MAKNSIRDFSATAASNTDIQSVDIDENCAASGINNAIRELMADLADVNAGTVAMTSPSADSLSTDTISEKTSGSGVTIDSVLLKDGALGSIASAVAAHLTSINGGQIGGNRNLIINGDMRIAARGASAVAAGAGTYPSIDRLKCYESTDGAFTLEQSTTVPSGQGFSNSAKFVVTTADTSLAAGQYAQATQVIEAQNLQHLSYGTSSAKTLSLSFWCRSSKTGTYCITIVKEDSTATHYVKEFSISSADTWEKKTITIEPDSNITASAGAIANDNGAGLYVYWNFAQGSTYTGATDDAWSTNTNHFATTNQVNWMDSTSNNFYLTGVQLEVGSTVTDFEHTSIADEEARCMRYFYKMSANSNTYAAQYQAGYRMAFVWHPVAMRATPTPTGTYSPSSGWSDYQTDRFHYKSYIALAYNSHDNAFISNMTFDAEL